MKIFNFSFPVLDQKNINACKTRIVNALQHTWISIASIPSHLSHLVQRISNFLKLYFQSAPSSEQISSSPIEEPLARRNVTVLISEQIEDKSKSIDSGARKSNDIAQHNILLSLSPILSEAVVDQNDGSKDRVGDPFTDLGDMQPREGVIQSEDERVFLEKFHEDIEARILEEACEALIKPANALLSSVNPKTKEEYADLILKLELQRKNISNEYATTFNQSEKEKTKLANKLKELIAKTNQLQINLCEHMRLNYRENPNIPGEGSCFYWSVRAAFEDEPNPDRTLDRAEMQTYRNITADYILDHKQDYYENLIPDTLEPGTLGEINAFYRTSIEELRQIDPSSFILYYTLLIKTPSEDIYATDFEVSALSKALQQPIFIFSPEGETWKVNILGEEFVEGEKKPIYLYYNGINHYQNLIPKR